MNKKPIISIAIPTYNGENTIQKTLECLISQIQNLKDDKKEEIEIVIKDDNSTDKTKYLLESQYNKYDFITIHYSDTNVGMDNNFRDVAILSKGEYVWYFGQDDLIVHSGITTVLNLIEQYKPNIISLNYKQVGSSGQIIDNSVFNKFSHKNVLKDHIYAFNNSEDYFKVFKNGPTFLPATIMKRSYWNEFNYLPFIGTFYVQAACILLNMFKGNILAYTEPIIIGLVPDNKWQSDGNSLVRILIGNLKMNYLVINSPTNPIPLKIYNKRKLKFIFRLYFLMGHANTIGYKSNDENLHNLLIIYSGKIERRIVSYILTINWKIHGPIYSLLNFFKIYFLKPILSK